MLNFPNNPTTDQEWTDPNSMLWKFNGEMWRRQSTSATPTTGTIPPGGLVHQILSKNSAADYDTEWTYIKADGGLF